MSRSLAAVISAMESGADRAKSIAAATGMKVESAHARLHELKRLGVVQSIRVGGRVTKCGHWAGEREKRYSLKTEPGIRG